MPHNQAAGPGAGSAQRTSAVFDVWGARGSRSITPKTSRIANYTSCYSFSAGADLFVFDGGRGLAVLSESVRNEERFQDVERVHLLLSHSHMDHWEGLKDASWFWRNGNGLSLHVYGSDEAMAAIRRGYEHPAYVPLEILAETTLAKLEFSVIECEQTRRIRGFEIQTFPLHHYSGVGEDKNMLSTLGYRLSSPERVTLAYLCDHEPSDHTVEVEAKLLSGTHLAVVDAHFSDRSQHAFGHGSQEHAASLARQYPDTLVLAAHHGPTSTDEDIRTAHEKHGEGLSNFRVAVEGMKLTWDGGAKRFK